MSVSTWRRLALSARSTWKSARPGQSRQSHMVSLLQGPTSKVRVVNAMSAFSRANVFGESACKHCKLKKRFGLCVLLLDRSSAALWCRPRLSIHLLTGTCYLCSFNHLPKRDRCNPMRSLLTMWSERDIYMISPTKNKDQITIPISSKIHTSILPVKLIEHRNNPKFGETKR